MPNVVIAGYKRSPFHLANKGALVRVRPDDMAARVIAALVEETKVDPNDLEDLIMGCAFPEGEQGFNIGRLSGLLAKLPLSVAGVTVNRFCGSSMQAIHMAAGAISIGAGEAFLCAGVESMTRVPMGGFNPMPNPKLMDPVIQAYISMGDTAENLAKTYDISRQAQEEFALASHRKAAEARVAGRFKAEIVPIETPEGVVDQDGCIRPDTSLEKLAELKPAFQVTGTVTAGTSSPLTDGASAVLVTSEDYAKAHGLNILARIKSIAVAGCAPDIMGIGPVPAAKKAMSRAGVTMADIDHVELNEAFAAQSMAVIRDLEIPAEKLNRDGGAIALGHPLGASGARITGKAAAILKEEGKRYALATMCIGGGMGIATVLEAV
jgi:acetyl-CoA acyltransferase